MLAALNTEKKEPELDNNRSLVINDMAVKHTKNLTEYTHKPKLLIVDDEPNIVNALVRILRSKEYDIVTANSGKEAISILQKISVNVILSDHRMPGLTGAELLAEAMIMQPDCVRIILSGYADLADITEAVNSGAIYKFLAKPWDDALLRAHINDSFKRADIQVEHRQLDQIFKNAFEAILITDANGIAISMNPAFQEVTGIYDNLSNELPTREIMFTKDEDILYDRMWSFLREHGRVQGEVHLLCKDGVRRSHWASISAIKNSLNEVEKCLILLTDISEQKVIEEKVDNLTRKDILTGLYNRKSFTESLELSVAKAIHDNSRLTLVILNINKLRKLNKKHSIPVIDKMLEIFSTRLSREIGNHIISGRISGDEFAFFLEGDDTLKISEQSIRLLKTLERPYTIDKSLCRIEISIGVASLTDNISTAQEMIEVAEPSLREVKHTGKHHYNKAHFSGPKDISSLNVDIYSAIEKNQLLLTYQPRIDIEKKEIIGAEAFFKWAHPEYGLIDHEHFLSLANETDIESAITSWLLHSICKQTKTWKDSGFTDMRISFSLLPYQLLDGNFLTVVKNSLKETGLSASNLELEITEEHLKRSGNTANSIMSSLHKLGVNFTIDNVGIKYTSLCYLTKFKFDNLKLNHTLIKNPGHNQTTIESLTSMAHKLGIKVICAGISSEKELDHLTSIGCDLVQSYLYSLPVSAPIFTRLLKSESLPDGVV